MMVSSHNEADYVLVSLCDITEITDLIKARKLGKPTITGGMISEVPIVNELSDYVYHGEIWGLVEFLKTRKGLIECNNITTKDKKALMINQEINWKESPIVRVGNKAAYYYCAKGCPIRCKYCLIGNARKYQYIPEGLYRIAERAIKKQKGRMMPIAAYNPHAAKTERAITEVLLKKYISGNGLGLKNSLIRTGVEFVSPKLSKELAKGVTIDDVNRALEISMANNNRMILYYIAGLESQEEVESYFSGIAIDYNIKPVITIVFTYLAPQLMTPMYDYNLSARYQIDAKRIFGVINERNKRIRVMPLANIKKSTIRALFERCTTTEEYDYICKLKRDSVTYDQVINEINVRYPHLMGTSDIDTCISRSRHDTFMTVFPYWDVGG